MSGFGSVGLGAGLRAGAEAGGVADGAGAGVVGAAWSLVLSVRIKKNAGGRRMIPQ